MILTSRVSPNVHNSHVRRLTVLKSLEDKLWSTGHSFGVNLRQEFRGDLTRTGVLFHGPAGWGEFSPFADYSDQRAALWLQAAIEAAYLPLEWAQDANVRINAIIGDHEDPAAATRRAIEEFGCTTIKVKVGTDVLKDLGKLDSIVSTARALNKSIRIRADANGRWSLEQALIACREMNEYPIDYVEQPCADRESLKALHRQVNVPIAVDESIRIDRLESVRDFADIAILKVSPLGGLRATHAIAQSVGVPVRVSGALETSVGLFPSLVAAWQLAPDHAAGLGTGALFAADLVSPITVPRGGVIPLHPMTPDLDLLAARALSDQNQQLWRIRFSAAFSLLPQVSRDLLTASL